MNGEEALATILDLKPTCLPKSPLHLAKSSLFPLLVDYALITPLSVLVEASLASETSHRQSQLET